MSAGLQAGVLQRRLAGRDGLLDQIVHERLELGPGELDGEMLRPVLVGGDEGQIDVGLRGAGELDLRLLGRVLQALQRKAILAQVDALLLAEFVGQVVDDALVEVLAAEEGVAVGRLDLEHAVADLEDRDVEGAAAEIVDGDLAGALLLQAVGQRGRGRLVDDAQHVQAGDLAGILGGLALGVVEIGRHGDDGLGDLAAEIGLGRLLHLREDEGADLARAVFLAFHLDPSIAVGPGDDLVGHHLLVLLRDRIVVAPADQPLDGEDGVLGIGDALALGRLAHQDLARIGEGHDRRRRARALGVLDHLRLAAFHDGDARVGRSEIDADCLGHDGFPSTRSRHCKGAIRHASVCRLMANCETCPQGRGRRARPVSPRVQAASLTSIFLVSLRAGLGMVTFSTPLDMVACTVEGSIPVGNSSMR